MRFSFLLPLMMVAVATSHQTAGSLRESVLLSSDPPMICCLATEKGEVGVRSSCAEVKYNYYSDLKNFRLIPWCYHLCVGKVGRSELGMTTRNWKSDDTPKCP